MRSMSMSVCITGGLIITLTLAGGCLPRRQPAESSKPTVSEVTTIELESGVLGEHRGAVFSVDACADGRRLISGGSNGTVKVWDLNKGAEVASFASCLTPGVRCVAASPDGKSFVAVGYNSGAYDQKIKLCDVETGQEILQLEGSDEFYQHAAFSPDGIQLVGVDTVRGGMIGMWDLSTGKKARTFRPQGRCVLRCVAFDPKGTRFIAADTIHDAATGSPIMVLQREGKIRCPMSVTFGREGNRIAFGYHDGGISIWDANRAIELATIEGHTGWVYCVDFDREGKMLASAGKDGVINIWDAYTGEKLLKVCELSDYVFAAMFTPDSRTLVSGHRDGTLRMWDISRLQQASESD
jgi:WD40 repeat protein